MFSKSKPTKPLMGAPPTYQGEAMLSIVGKGTAINGDIESDGDLHVEGSITGNVSVRTLAVSETAYVKGNVACEMADIKGRLEGNVEARSVHLHASSSVEGNVIHGELTIEPGAFINGEYRHQDFDAIRKENGAAPDSTETAPTPFLSLKKGGGADEADASTPPQQVKQKA